MKSNKCSGTEQTPKNNLQGSGRHREWPVSQGQAPQKALAFPHSALPGDNSTHVDLERDMGSVSQSLNLGFTAMWTSWENP